MKSSDHPLEIVETGINSASTFKGYCDRHDAALFHSVDNQVSPARNSTFRSLHLRAMSLELCRKRRSFDFIKNLRSLSGYPTSEALEDAQSAFSDAAREMQQVLSVFFTESDVILPVDYYAIGIGRRLGVAACGCFDFGGVTKFGSVGYNILPYTDATLVVLTCLGSNHQTLDPYFNSFVGDNPYEQMVNDLLFLRGEEPLISPHIWQNMSEIQKLQIRQCLVHPNHRNVTFNPRFIKIQASEFIADTNHPIWTRLFSAERLTAPGD